MVPALQTGHLHFARATAALTERIGRGDTMILAAHAVAETYSTLTRMPPPNRLRPTEALALIETNFLRRAETVVTLEAAAYLELVRRAPADGVIGGRIYDALIAACARQGRVNALLTFNDRHFRAIVGSSIAVVVP